LWLRRNLWAQNLAHVDTPRPLVRRNFQRLLVGPSWFRRLWPVRAYRRLAACISRVAIAEHAHRVDISGSARPTVRWWPYRMPDIRRWRTMANDEPPWDGFPELFDDWA